MAYKASREREGDMANVICKRCKRETDELAVFPGGICLACYEKAYDATPEQERETIARVFGPGAVRKIRVKR